MKAKHDFSAMFVLLVLTLTVGRVQAVTVRDLTVSDFFQGIEYVTEDTLLNIQINISQTGPYKAKLVDFQDSAPFDILSLAITQDGTVLTPDGLWDTGSVTFNVSGTSEPLVARLQANPTGGLGLYGLQVLPIPIPPAFWLFLSGLTGIVTLARRGTGPGTV